MNAEGCSFLISNFYFEKVRMSEIEYFSVGAKAVAKNEINVSDGVSECGIVK